MCPPKSQAPANPPPPGESLYEIDRRILARVAEVNERLLAIGRDLAAVAEADGFRRLGYSGPGQYGETRGVGPVGRTHDILRIGRMLDGFPETRKAFLEGRLTLERAAAVCQVAQPGDEHKWCEKAVGATTPEVLREVRAERVARGECPPTRRLSLEFRPEDERDFDAACAQLSRDLGRVVREGEAVGELSRHYVECRDSRRRRTQPLRSLAPEDRVPPEAKPGARYVPSAVARAVWERDKGRCQVPGCTFHFFVDLGHIVARWLGGLPIEANLICICHAHNILMEAGLLVIRGTAFNPTFEHHDGRPFGSPPPPPLPQAGHGPSP